MSKVRLWNRKKERDWVRTKRIWRRVDFVARILCWLIRDGRNAVLTAGNWVCGIWELSLLSLLQI